MRKVSKFFQYVFMVIGTVTVVGVIAITRTPATAVHAQSTDPTPWEQVLKIGDRIATAVEKLAARPDPVCPASAAQPEPPKVELTAPAPTPDLPAQEFAQAKTCVGIVANDQSYVEKTLVPGQTLAGDIEVFINNEWKVFHDSGIGEYTVVRNTGTTDVRTRGRWGAGCLQEVNQKIVVNGEFSNPNHGDLVRVRDVEVKDNTFIETMFTSPLP